MKAKKPMIEILADWALVIWMAVFFSAVGAMLTHSIVLASTQY